MSTNLTTKNARKAGMDVLSRLFYKTAKNNGGYDEEFFYIVYKAKQEIADAENFFDNVTEPELIDHAIYKMEAAKSQYAYLIKQAKEKGIRVNI